MAKKEKVSINMLEKYCKTTSEKEKEMSVKISDNEDIVFRVKYRLSLKECIEFIEDVVGEYINRYDVAIVPIAMDYIFNRCLMTYYANFTMPKNEETAFELVSGSKEIISMIRKSVDLDQCAMLYSCAKEKIEFEIQKMLSINEARMNQAMLEIEDFTSRMEDLFGGVDGEQISEFIKSMSAISQNGEITPQEIANAIVRQSGRTDE